jgi:fructokinase
MILVSGEALIDLIPDPDKASAYDAVRGGSPYNVAIGLGRLGTKTAFVSRISTDGNGEALAALLSDNGVDLSLVVRDKRPKQWPTGARHLHVGSFSAVERHGQTVAEAMAAARGHATVSFDPNIRPFVTPDRDAVSALVERQVALSHVVKASEEDFEWLYPGRPVEESLAAWAKAGPRFCVATLGERGAVAVADGDRIEVPAPKIDVVDTVGAGDSFMSALLSAMDRDAALGGDSGVPRRAQIEAWLRFAAAASAITCTRKGSNPPTRAEVEAALRG